jgi:hypothetical protein
MKLKLIAMLAATSLAAISCKATTGGAEPEVAESSGDGSGSGDSSSGDSSSSSSDSGSGDPLTQGDAVEKDAYGRPKDKDDGDPAPASSEDKPKDEPKAAKDDKAKDDKGVKDEAKGAKVTKGIPMPVFPGLKFGMSLEQIAKLNDKDIDAEYKKKFLAASPTQTLAIEDEVRDKKGVFRRSRIDFLDTPTGIDQSALKGEYSYGNKESMARMLGRTRDDGKELPARNFFFFDDKLWKVYEEYKLGPKSNLGADFGQAVAKLTKVFGGPPQKVAADFKKGQSFDEAVWNDGEKVIRAIDRGDTLGMAFVDKKVQDNLARYRTRQLEDQHAIDKDVKAATANPPTQVTGPPKDEKAKDKPKK